MRYYAVCGGHYASDWFGNPWWEVALGAWAKQEQPVDDDDLDLALSAPNELDDDGIRWLMRAKYDRSFRDAITAWISDRRGLKADHPGGLWFPPGVPALAPRLR